MGLGGFNNDSNSTYLTIGMGKDEKGRDRAVIGRRARKGDPGAVQVFNHDGTPAKSKDGDEIYRTEYGFVEGIINKIERTSGEYGDRLGIHITAGVESFILQLDRGSRYWVDFAHRCNNINFGKPVKLHPYSIPREDDPKKSNQLLVAYQDGAKVEKWKFEEISKGGSHEVYFDEDEKEWRFGKRDRFLDEGPIEKAIQKVIAFNNLPMDDDDTPVTSDPQASYGATPPDDVPLPVAADEPGGDDAPF